MRGPTARRQRARGRELHTYGLYGDWLPLHKRRRPYTCVVSPETPVLDAGDYDRNDGCYAG